MEREPFGTLPDGREVDVFTLTNANGAELRAMTYGGIVLSLKVPDRNGRLGDVVLGYDDLEGYLEESPYFGAIIGRYGNRIADARFELDGEVYELAANDGDNHLHGGVEGFDKKLWDAEGFRNEEGVGIVFTRLSPDGEEGYPGNLEVRVTYTLTDANEVVFDYHATTDEATPVNLTQHTYFNLAADGIQDVEAHRLIINADHYTPVDEELIPTGEIATVIGTPFDFRRAAPIGFRVEDAHPQIQYAGGYDHNFVLNREGIEGARSEFSPPGGTAPGELLPAVYVYEPFSGRVMEVHTTEPGVQFYSGNFLDGTITGKGGVVYAHRFGFCLETQHYPDSPNEPDFPSTILRPGEEYTSRTVYRFGVEGKG